MSEALNRLARSRQALAQRLIKPDKDERRRREAAAELDAGQDGPGSPYLEAAGEVAEHVSGWWSTLKHAGRVWWRYHPARAAADLAEPALKSYARAHPARLIGIAAVAGAAIIIARPWRLVSVGGLLVAALRPTELSAVVLSLLSVGGRDGDDDSRGRHE
ncbi:MAG: hypothetical protein ABW051_08630 [Burkholderiaceae bacterium]